MTDLDKMKQAVEYNGYKLKSMCYNNFTIR